MNRKLFAYILIIILLLSFVGCSSPKKEIDKTPDESNLIISSKLVSVKDNIVEVEYKNNTKTEFMYGHAYSLFKWDGEKWEEIEMNIAFDEIGFILEALGNTNDDTVNLGYTQIKLDKGEYKLRKSFIEDNTNSPSSPKMEVFVDTYFSL